MVAVPPYGPIYLTKRGADFTLEYQELQGN